MRRIPLFLLCLFLTIAAAGAAVAKDKGAETRDAQGKAPAAKRLTGISIVGNDEAPKSLYIVPWKKSEVGATAGLHMMLTESAVPVDREEFMRQLDLYDASTRK